MVLYQRDETFPVIETITAGDILYLDTSGNARPCGATFANTLKIVGVAATDAVSGGYVAAQAGRQTLYANTAIAPGQRIKVDEDDGQLVKAFVSGATANEIIGFALTATSGTRGSDETITCFLW